MGTVCSPYVGSTRRRRACAAFECHKIRVTEFSYTFRFDLIREDIAAIRSKDPAATSALNVWLSYPGFHAIRFHRLANALWCAGFKTLGRWVSHCSRFLTGIEIHPAAFIGRRVFIDHGMGIVIGETAEVHDDCTIYQGVTLGGTSLERGAKRHPTLARGVTVSAGAKVLGSFTVGEGATIGSNSVVLKAVPAGATAVGIPARIIPSKAGESADVTTASPKFSAYGITLEDDPLGQAMKGLIDNASSQEHQIALLWQAIEKLSEISKAHRDCVPGDAALQETFEAEKINQLMGK